MTELVLYGLKFFIDGTKEETLIRRQEATGDYETDIRVCENLPTAEYDGFLLIDGQTGKQFPLNLNKPLRQRTNL